LSLILRQGHVILEVQTFRPYRDLNALPTNYVIDWSGKLAHSQAAAFDLDALNTIVRAGHKTGVLSPGVRRRSSRAPGR
jgi:hypothetical protein